MLETKKIGNKIAEARKRVNISQAQLAERLLISPQAVGKWERGESKLKRVRFIDCKADRLTYEFLKQGNADLTSITLLTPGGGNE